MSRKRDKPYPSRHVPASFSKRRRPPPPHPPPSDADIVDVPIDKPSPPPAVLVTGLHSSCSVLDLKSRFEIYGPISRIRIDRDGVGYITYRTKDAGEAAIAASLDPSFGITIDSKKVQVLWVTDPLAQWREGVGMGVNMDNRPLSSSKLLRGEAPLSRRGRGNKLASAIVNPRSSTSDGTNLNPSSSSRLEEAPFKGREIVAYDDIL